MVPEATRTAYQHSFPKDTNGTSLSNWGEFENNNPSTFQNMYQFWAYKALQPPYDLMQSEQDDQATQSTNDERSTVINEHNEKIRARKENAAKTSKFNP